MARPQARKNRRRYRPHFVGRSLVQWILANGKSPPALPPFENIIGTLRILSTRERSWGPFSAACYLQQLVSGRTRNRSGTCLPRPLLCSGEGLGAHQP